MQGAQQFDEEEWIRQWQEARYEDHHLSFLQKCGETGRVLYVRKGRHGPASTVLITKDKFEINMSCHKLDIPAGILWAFEVRRLLGLDSSFGDTFTRSMASCTLYKYSYVMHMVASIERLGRVEAENIVFPYCLASAA